MDRGLDLETEWKTALADFEAFYTAEYDKLLAYAPRRGADPNDLVQESFAKGLDALDACDSAGALDAWRARWLNPSYVTRVIQNLRADAFRAVKREERKKEEPYWWLPGGKSYPVDEAWVPDDIPNALAMDDRNRALRAMLRVLVALGEQRPQPAVRITQQEWETVVAVASADDPNDVPDVALDAELDQWVHDQQVLARERWLAALESVRAGRGWPRRAAGDATGAAERLGVNRSTISRRLSNVRAALLATRYLAGVLADSGVLLDRHLIMRQLTLYGEQRAESPADAVLLQQAAPFVATTEELGTRVDQDRWETERPAVVLHDAEAEFVDRTKAAEANCVTACLLHNPTRTNRITEF